MIKLGWFEIYVEDMNRALRFYKAILQYDNFIDLTGGSGRMMAFPTTDAIQLNGALVQTDKWKSGPGGVLIYLDCNNCKETEKKVIDAGGKVIKPKYSVGSFGYCSIIEDTEGNVLGLHSMT